jgi:serine protease Do
MREHTRPPARARTVAHSRRLLAAGALVAAVAAGLHGVLTTPALAAIGEAPVPAANQALPGSFADLVAIVKPAVVNISAVSTIPVAAREMPQLPFAPGSPFERFFREFGGQPGPGPAPGPRPGMPGPGAEARSAGSGFVIDPGGLIVTNHHVVEGAKELTVTFEDGRQLQAEIVGTDDKTDLALLRVDARGPLPHVRFGDSDTSRVGDWVIAVGNPFGLGGSVTAGIISARGRDIRSGPYDDFLQIDAPINRGNSGGPLFDRAGKVIGVNTAIFSPTGGSVGIGFAIPSNMVREVVAELEHDGQVERGWLGVQVQPVTDEVAEGLRIDGTRGALVADVVDDGPAARAGIEPGDVIVAFDGQQIEHVRELPRLVARANAGKKATLELSRGGEMRTVEVAIGRMPGRERVSSAAEATPRAGDTARIGVTLAPLTDDVRARLSLAPGVRGVVVAGVEADGAAARRGIAPGDVILRVGREVVDAPEQVARAIGEAAGSKRESVLLLVRRDDGVRYVAVPLARV